MICRYLLTFVYTCGYLLLFVEICQQIFIFVVYVPDVAFDLQVAGGMLLMAGGILFFPSPYFCCVSVNISLLLL